MKLHVALCFLLFAGCATTSSPHAAQASLKSAAGTVGTTPEQAELVRVETSAGAFLVSPPQAQDFKKVLSGEPAPASFSADVSW